VDKTTLNTVAFGQAPVVFERELQRVMENIANADVSPTSVRKLTLEFTFKPDVTRREISIHVDGKSKLVEAVGVAGLMYLANNDGELQATNSNPRQLSLVDQLAEAQERKA
jgi:hypothetical protein